MYSIGQVAEMFGLPISTLRYYDKQGLFPNMERVSGIRKIGDTEIEGKGQILRPTPNTAPLICGACYNTQPEDLLTMA